MPKQVITEEAGIESFTGVGDFIDPLTQVQELLRAKDDTSRFVGLAILKSILDGQPQIRENPDTVNALWEAVSSKFLDRLLRARQNEKVAGRETTDMVDIAVAVLHTFTVLLPPEKREDKRLLDRLHYLIVALVNSSPETTVLILQTILTFVSQPLGALELIGLVDISPLTEIAPQYSLVLDIFGLALSSASLGFSEVTTIQCNIDRIVALLLISFASTDAVTFLAFLGDILPRLPHEALPDNPPWLHQVVAIWQQLVISRPTLAARSAYTQVAAALLQVYPNSCPFLLFTDRNVSNMDSKPFSYLFVNLLLIDLRSSFPSLLSKLNSDEYSAISKRLASAFDVVSSFIGFLLRSLEDDNISFSSTSFTMAPDLLLKLRKDIAETMSLTIEYMRDRWDASIAGTAGLQPSARAGSSTTSEGIRLTLTWDSMKVNITSDNLILAAIRTLAIWLREDENKELRIESAGLMDMFVELYMKGSSSDLNFRYPILTALEAILTTEEGVHNILAENGLEVLSQDLMAIIAIINAEKGQAYESDASRGVEIVRVLLTVLDHPSTTEPKEDWMKVVKLASSMRQTSLSYPIVIELQIAVLQLSTALLNLSSRGMLTRYTSCIPGMVGFAQYLRIGTRQLGGAVGQELCDLVDDVLLSLESLR